MNLVSVKEGIDTSIPIGEIIATMLYKISKIEIFNVIHPSKYCIANVRLKNCRVWEKKTNLID